MSDPIEAMARAMEPDGVGDVDRETVRRMLRAAEKAGWVLVPKEPNMEMRMAARDAFLRSRDCYPPYADFSVCFHDSLEDAMEAGRLRLR
jgi:hypothetical protein